MFFMILLIIISLGGILLQRGKVCLVEEEQIDASVLTKYILLNSLFVWAVKLILRGLYLLNNFALINAKKVAQITLNQLQNIKFEG